MVDRFFSPRKSILMRPVSSITEPSYCVQLSLSPVSLSSAVLMGTQSETSSLQMITPQACTPRFRTLPSSIWAYFMVSLMAGLGDACASASAGTHSRQFFRFIFRGFPLLSSGRRSGMALHQSLDMFSGTFCTRATSLMAILVAIVPYVMMCVTFSSPYFCVTQDNTFPRPSSSKSTSISGNEIRSGFRKRSNSKSYLMGSTFVIPRQYATSLPAALPRPGPTETCSSWRAALM